MGNDSISCHNFLKIFHLKNSAFVLYNRGLGLGLANIAEVINVHTSSEWPQDNYPLKEERISCTVFSC